MQWPAGRVCIPDIVQANRTGHATYQVVRVWIFTPKDCLNFDNLLLPLKGFKVVGNCHEVGFRRKLIGRVPPIAVGEDAELPAFNKFFQPRLYIREPGELLA